ncbi:MAG: glycosyltransferase family 2 protein [Pikeienuella sp.]
MDLSIVIINWNTREMLRDCLQTVYDNIGTLEAEVFVVDNASEDGSQEMVEKCFPQVLLTKNTDNRGFAAANNQALKDATGRHVLLLNSDTLVHGDVLTTSVAYLDNNPKVGVMGCRVHNTDGSMQATCSRFPSLLNLTLLTTGLWKYPVIPFFDRYQMTTWDRTDERAVDVVSGCYMLVRKTAMDAVGLLDEAFFFYGEETDWCRRYQKAGWELMFAPVGVITHFGGGSVKKLNHKRDVMLTEGTVRLHRKHFGLIGGLACWLLLGGFNLSRAVAWSLVSIIGGARAKERGRHFRRVISSFRQAWPKMKTAKAKI